MNEEQAWATRAALVAGGFTGPQIEALCRVGALHRIRRGAYLPSEDWEALDVYAQHLLQAAELGHSLGPGAVLSHASAAVLHGLPVPDLDLSKVHVTWPASPGRRTTTNTHPHRALLLADEQTIHHGLLVTTPARTVYDVARSGSFQSAVALADAALHARLCTKEDLEAICASRAGWPGSAAAGRVAAFADGRAESVGESYSRIQMARIGLPSPDLQVEIRGHRGVLLGRVDFDLPDLGTVAEFDGRVKYDRYLKAGQTPAEAVVEEKIREDRIRDTGRQMVRLVWEDLDRDAAVRRRFEAAALRAGRPIGRSAAHRADRPIHRSVA